MIKQEWVEEESSAVYFERKRKCRFSESMDYIKLALMMAFVFFCSTNLQAEDYRVYHVCGNDGVWFMCKNCRVCQWQASNQADWRGNYYCVICGEKYE